ncbi:MAG: ribonuclease E inhibitor RraB [Myxococcales bacterium]|nr:ribonuclease E inhibitor RraB [Myxococcales bacterium]
MLMEMFERMQVEAGWDVNSKLLWGYFFTNKSPAKLHAAGEDLRAKGYRLVKVFQDDEKENYWLHVEREEVHTPQSLFDRNQELAEFAAEHDLATYDGMDVGPIQVAK